MCVKRFTLHATNIVSRCLVVIDYMHYTTFLRILGSFALIQLKLQIFRKKSRFHAPPTLSVLSPAAKECICMYYEAVVIT